MSQHACPADPSDSPSAPAGKPTRWLREPLLHFLLLAGLIFGVQQWRQASSRPTIAPDVALLNSLAKQFEQRRGRPPTQREWQQTADTLVEEELLFREAQARGMTADTRVRSLLIEMMRSSLKPVTPEPTDAELESVRGQIPENNRFLPPQISFEHVSFTALDRVPADLLPQLRAGASPNGLGDAVRLANPLPLTFQPQIERLLGAEFSARVFALPTGEWHGPFASTRGAHLVRVVERTAPRELPFVELRPMLREEWMRERNRAAITAELRKLAQHYRVIVPAPPANLPP